MANTTTRQLTPEEQKLAQKALGTIGAVGNVVGNLPIPGSSVINTTIGNAANTANTAVSEADNYPTSNPDADTKAYIDQLISAQRNSRIAALDSAKNSALSSLSGEESGIAPQYYDKRNQAAAQSDIGALNFAQYQAARGIKGAAAAMPDIYRNAALQGEVGSLNRQEQAAKDDIGRRRSEIETNYQSDLAGVNADMDAQSMQMYIDAMNADRAFALQEAGTTGTYKGSPTLAGQEYTDNKQKDLESTYQANIGRFYSDFAAEINNVKNDGDPSNDWQIPYLEAARETKKQTMAANQKAAEDKAAAAKTAAEQEAYDRAKELWETSGVVTSQEQADILGVPVGAKTADYNIDSINAQTSRMNAQTSRINANKPSSSSNNPYSNIQNSADFQADFNDIIQNPANAVSDLTANSQAYIQKYGVDGYNELLAKAKEVDPKYVPLTR